MNRTPTSHTQAAWKTIEKWIENVNHRDIDGVLSLYSNTDTAFWGTFANHIRTNRDEVRTYFDRFLDVDSIACRIDENIERQITTEVVSFTGIYTFTIVKNSGDSATQSTARFTFTLRYNAEHERWMIVEHHSSLMPENGF